jgi:hypothetical protein
MKALLSIILLIAMAPAMTAQQKESIKIDWPKDWKIGSDQQQGQLHMVEMIPKKDDIEKWTTMGTTMTLSGVTGVGPEAVMQMTMDQTKKNAPDATLIEIARDLTAENPWILFKIEAPHYTNADYTESQLYYAVQGKQNLYSNFVALKVKELPKDFVDKWSAIFKASKITKQ